MAANSEVKLIITTDASGAVTGIKNLKNEMEGISKSAGSINDAYKKLGIESEQSIRQQMVEAQKAYDKIKSSGTASAGDIIKAEQAKSQRVAALYQQLSKDAGGAAAGVNSIGSAASSQTASVTGFSASLGSMVSAVAGIASLAALKQFVTSTISDFEKLQSAMTGLAAVARYSGAGIGKSMDAALNLSKDGLISVQASSQALQNLLSRGFSLNQAVQMLTRLKDAAAFNRQSHLTMSEAVISSTEGIKNENSVLVDNAGVTKNVSVMWKEYAASIKKSVDDLTLAEKRQAEYLGIMKETEGQIGNAKVAADTLTGAKARLTNQITDLSSRIGESLTPAFLLFGKAMEMWIEGLKYVVVYIKGIGVAAAFVAGMVTPLFDALRALVTLDFKGFKKALEAIFNPQNFKNNFKNNIDAARKQFEENWNSMFGKRELEIKLPANDKTRNETVDLAKQVEGLAKRYEEATKKAQDNHEARIKGIEALMVGEKRLSALRAEEMKNIGESAKAAAKYYEDVDKEIKKQTEDLENQYQTKRKAETDKYNQKDKSSLSPEARAAEYYKYQEELNKIDRDYAEQFKKLHKDAAEAKAKAAVKAQEIILKSVDEALKKETEAAQVGQKKVDILKEEHELRLKMIEASGMKSRDQQSATIKEDVSYYKTLTTAITANFNERIAGLDKYKAGLEELGKKEKQVAEVIKQAQGKVLQEKIKVAEESKKALTAALNEVLSKEKQYADQVKSLDNELKNLRQSNIDKIRDLKRSRMTEEEQLKDKASEADQKMSAAKRALQQGDYDQAKKLAQDAQSLYIELGKAYKGDEGKFNSMVAAATSAGSMLEYITGKQRDEAEKARKSYADLAEQLKNSLSVVGESLTKFNEELKKLTSDKKTTIEFQSTGLEGILKDYTGIKDKTVTITVNEVKKQGYNSGGLVYPRVSGHLPGWGTYDSVPAMLTMGEYVVDNRTVSRLGVDFLHQLRYMPPEAARGLLGGVRNPGKPFILPPKGIMADKETYRKIEISVNGITLPAYANKDLIDEFETKTRRNKLSMKY
ncbi:hypothetical protein [Candidatus Magnetominusculus xianensis]|uniref:Uncharacterized protein n=1 Tax=Candidatus Magnetominusculus xianensis TaxID=1748249 RepID=A0ABR5SE24_9BACT|nr:hypothetical protein [Candidatus Magnetominusculus xianensis]KWT81140.1 hypothetical protein ASN18_2646 [Candidatus Magnetominusculus xianensis]MBF0402970.1 hypothetical protein [Nitrospirota bacterium]